MPRRNRSSRPASSVPSLVKDLVDQFDRPLDFFRELIQNAIDAGSNRIDVTLEHDGESCVIRVDDDGEGMDERIIDEYLLVLFRSTKEQDFTKIGKFGIGFVSVFALRPHMVRVLTAKGGESWRLDFPSYKRYEKYKLSQTREGTLVELHKKMTGPEFLTLVKESREAIRYWCKHSEARIFFAAQGAEPEEITEPFGLPGASHRYQEEGTELEVAFSAEEKPFYGYYNRGLTLKEGNEALFPGVTFKAKSRYLEHTLTRDNVLVDENYSKLMAILKRIVEKELPGKLREELRDATARITRRACALPYPVNGTGPDPELAKLAAFWRERTAYLQWLFSGFFSRWRRSDWVLFPALTGRPLSLAAVNDSLEASGRRIYYDEAPNRITRALERQGAQVLAAGPWVDCLAAWSGAPAVKASEALIHPELLQDGKLDPALKGFLAALRWLDAQSGMKYQGIAAADFSYPGSPLKDKLFVTQSRAGSLTRADERPVSGLLWFRGKRRWALLNAAHPAAEKLARLGGKRPGLAAFLCLKMMHLHDGEVPPGKRTEYTNLAEKTEARLLAGALRLDTGKARAG